MHFLYHSNGQPKDSALAVALSLEMNAGAPEAMWLCSEAVDGRLLTPLPRGIKFSGESRLGRLRASVRAPVFMGTHGMVRVHRSTFTVNLWHGIPLKAMGSRNSGRAGHPVVGGTPWDLIVSPSPFYDVEIVEALGWRGRILRCPLPRYDLLAMADEELNRRTVRSRLGDGPIILYAPTYRAPHDRIPDQTPRWAAEVREALGSPPGFVALLHQLTSSGRLTVDSSSEWLRHEDPLVVLATCDVLITDYSSLLFDAAILNKPSILLAPDIDDYKVSPGLNLDLDAIAGPILAKDPREAGRLVEGELASGGMYTPLREELLRAATGEVDANLARGGAKRLVDALAAEGLPVRIR